MNTTIPLGEIVEIRGGGTPSRSVEAYWGGPIPWATVKDFKSTCLDATLESITPEGVVNSATNIIPPGAIIVPTRMAVGKAAINSVELAINQDLKALLPRENIDQQFLLHFLLSKAPFLEGRAQGATVKGIKLDVLRSLEFPILSREEQRRIADILNKADGIRRKREQTLEMINQAIESSFLRLFGDPARNPKGWREHTIDELGVVQGGLQVSKNRDALPLRKPYLRVANVFRDRLNLEEVKEIGLTSAEFERVQLHEGDVLIVEGHGNPDQIGRASVWDGSLTGCVHQNHLIRFRVNRSVVLPEYISRMLNSQGGRRQLIAAGRTTSGLNTISTRKVKEVVVRIHRLSFRSISCSCSASIELLFRKWSLT